MNFRSSIESASQQLGKFKLGEVMNTHHTGVIVMFQSKLGMLHRNKMFPNVVVSITYYKYEK